MACCQPIVIPDPVNNQLSNYALTTVAGAGAGTGTVLRTNDGYATESNANGSVLRTNTYLTYTPSGSNILLATDSATSVYYTIGATSNQTYYTVASSNIIGNGDNAYLVTANFRIKTLTTTAPAQFMLSIFANSPTPASRQIAGQTYYIDKQISDFEPFATIGCSAIFVPTANESLSIDIYNLDSNNIDLEFEPTDGGNGIYQLTRGFGSLSGYYTPTA